MRAVIFANGRLERPDLAAKLPEPDDFIIAADGGLKHVRELGLIPDLLIGDLDSLQADDLAWIEEHRVEVRKFPKEKNFTDLELAIQAALQEGADEILLIAALGGRFDQTLANLQLLFLPQMDGCRLFLDDGVTEAQLIRGRLTIQGETGDIVSLIPFCQPAEGVVTHRLKYPLRAETLAPGQTRGISNIMLEDTAEVELAGGTLLCVHIRRGIYQ